MTPLSLYLSLLSLSSFAFHFHSQSLYLQVKKKKKKMLDYEWSNPSSMMLTGEEEPGPDSDHTRQIFDHYTQQQQHHHQQQPFHDHTGFNPHHHHQTTATNAFSHAQAHFNPHQTQTHSQFHSLYDPRAYSSASAASYHQQAPQLLSLDPVPGAAVGSGSAGYLVVPKSEDASSRPPVDFVSRIGLNLGGRTYFSSAEDEFVNRLYRRARPANEPGSGNSPRCQAEGCNADLTHAKHYHRRHKVCEFHSKASTVLAAGLTQRFCQQCSRLSHIYGNTLPCFNITLYLLRGFIKTLLRS